MQCNRFRLFNPQNGSCTPGYQFRFQGDGKHRPYPQNMLLTDPLRAWAMLAIALFK
jgi:hypothetical protein